MGFNFGSSIQYGRKNTPPPPPPPLLRISSFNMERAHLGHTYEVDNPFLHSLVHTIRSTWIIKHQKEAEQVIRKSIEFIDLW